MVELKEDRFRHCRVEKGKTFCSNVSFNKKNNKSLLISYPDTLLREIFATHYFRDFKVCIFRDT